jgi:hypothetical protein
MPDAGGCGDAGRAGLRPGGVCPGRQPLKGMIAGANEASTIILAGRISERMIAVGTGTLTTIPRATTWWPAPQLRYAHGERHAYRYGQRYRRFRHGHHRVADDRRGAHIVLAVGRGRGFVDRFGDRGGHAAEAPNLLIFKRGSSCRSSPPFCRAGVLVLIRAPAGFLPRTPKNDLRTKRVRYTTSTRSGNQGQAIRIE